MTEGLVLAVDIAHKMLGALREIQDGGKVNYLPRERTLVGIFFGQKLKVFFIIFHYAHGAPPKIILTKY
jgi:hypothetical protein